MQMKDFRPAKDFALNYGCKAVIYGKAGCGKTPIAETSPRPLMLICEPGMLSMRHSNMPTYPAFTVAALDDFFNWLINSKEASNFDTVCIDSVSQMCEMVLTDELKKNKDGRKAYGELSRKIMDKLNSLYFMPQKHLYLIFKEQKFDDNGIIIKRPYAPGQDLPIKIPHLFDCVLHLAKVPIPNVGEHLAFRCIGSYDVIARNRTGTLSEFEQPNFSAIVTKCMV